MKSKLFGNTWREIALLVGFAGISLIMTMQVESILSAVVVGEDQPLKRVTPPKSKQKKDAKHENTEKPEPPRNPELIEYGIYADEAPDAVKTMPSTTTLPLLLQKRSRIRSEVRHPG